MIWVRLLEQVLKNYVLCYCPTNHPFTLGEWLTVSGTYAVQTLQWSVCFLQPRVQRNVEVLSCLSKENIRISGKKDGLIWSTAQEILELDWDHLALYWSDFSATAKVWLQCNCSQVCLYFDAKNLAKPFSPKVILNVFVIF